ncbi:MAG: hypothetical protein QOD03_53 [Verrucomicrobiota bacterium]|jgi:hypothetical protein
MSTERPTRTIPLWKPVVWGVALTVIFLQFRLLSFILIFLSGVSAICFATCRRRLFTIPAMIVIGISLFLPFDIALGSFHFGLREGTTSGGPHFVRFVVGFPKHTELIERYGEYVSAGCAWLSFLRNGFWYGIDVAS